MLLVIIALEISLIIATHIILQTLSYSPTPLLFQYIFSVLVSHSCSCEEDRDHEILWCLYPAGYRKLRPFQASTQHVENTPLRSSDQTTTSFTVLFPRDLYKHWGNQAEIYDFSNASLINCERDNLFGFKDSNSSKKDYHPSQSLG